MILCISVLTVVISPFSFLILLIWFFSLCFLMSLANDLSILFILSKNQLLALLIFAKVSFVYFAFISALIFKISFLQLTLGFIMSSFSSCFSCRVRLFIWFFLVSWGKPVLLWTFPLVLLLQCPTGFGLLQHHNSNASVLQCSAFFMVQHSHPYMTTGKTIALTKWTFVGKLMSLLSNMLSRLAIAFLSRS